MKYVCITMRSDLHPFECGQNCIHCRREQTETHRPANCVFCWDDMTADSSAVAGLFAVLFEVPQFLLVASTK